jgi:hypothetical protein
MGGNTVWKTYNEVGYATGNIIAPGITNLRYRLDFGYDNALLS